MRRIAEVFSAFLLLGLTSFGGPVAHLGYFRTAFVVRRAWLDEQAYADLVALCQFLPGPASSQVGMAIGHHRAGWAGALAAWIGFTAPSAVLLYLVGVETPYNMGAEFLSVRKSGPKMVVYGSIALILIYLLHRWYRSDTTRARAADRQADELGDPDLAAYNAYLARLRGSGDNTRPTPNTLKGESK